MTARFSKALRQRIVEEFARRHNGNFNPALFVEEVRRIGQDHPAHAWFEWDRDAAAHKWQVEQAREFARDLRITFKVEEVGPATPVRIREQAMPLVLSPLSGRSHGGGYVLTDPEDPEHMAEHCQQAAVALRAWVNRYGATLPHVGLAREAVMDVVQVLEANSPQTAEAA